MKKQFPFILLLIGLNSPAKAQFGWDGPVVEARSVTIDPQARDLLARLNWKYKQIKSFQCVIESLLSPARKMPYRRYRIVVDVEHNRGIVTTASPRRGIQKSVFDGQAALFLDSQVPNQFKWYKPKSINFDVFLGLSEVQGTGIDLLLNDNLASQLLNPFLESIEMGKTEVFRGKTLQNVVLTTHTSSSKESYRLAIDTQNWVLYRTVSISRSFTTSSTTTFTQNYSQIQFDEEFPKNLFSTVAPKGYRAVEFLGDPNQPYEYD